MKFDVLLRNGAVVVIERPDFASIIRTLVDEDPTWIYSDGSLVLVDQIDAITEHVDIDAPIPFMPVIQKYPLHFAGVEPTTPCGITIVGSPPGFAYTSLWASATCPACLAEKP